MNAVAVKRRLFELLAGSPDLSGVQVAYSEPGAIEREAIFGGRMSAPVAAAAMRASGARQPREERAQLALYIRVDAEGDDPSVSEARAAVLGLAVENFVAANPKLSEFPGLLDLAVSGWEMESGRDDDGAITVLTYELTVWSYLT